MGASSERVFPGELRVCILPKNYKEKGWGVGGIVGCLLERDLKSFHLLQQPTACSVHDLGFRW